MIYLGKAPVNSNLEYDYVYQKLKYHWKCLEKFRELRQLRQYLTFNIQSNERTEL